MFGIYQNPGSPEIKLNNPRYIFKVKRHFSSLVQISALSQINILLGQSHSNGDNQ